VAVKVELIAQHVEQVVHGTTLARPLPVSATGICQTLGWIPSSAA
jgi:hypothetical protein